MASPSSPVNSSSASNNDEESIEILEPLCKGEEEVNPAVKSENSTEDTSPSKTSQTKPAQKRRRVTRACDECRRKKIKCDGKQPCTHCTVYSYDCTYDQPSNRRRNPAPQFIEALENRLHKAEAILKAIVPNLSLDDPRFENCSTEQLIAALRKDMTSNHATSKASLGAQPDSIIEGGEESLLETMVENSGSLDLDDQGHWDYRGHSSGIIFLQRLRKQFGSLELEVPEFRPSSAPYSIYHVWESPKSLSESPHDSISPSALDLPSREAAKKLCRDMFDHACVLTRFVHGPTFFSMVDRIYDIPPDQFTNEEHTFLPLFYASLSVGCLFADGMEGNLGRNGYKSAIDQGIHYFKAGRQLLDITDCRDLTSMQAICCMILFLQSSASLSTCYCYVGIALRAALRLGLHRSVAANFNPIEREMRKRLFWVVRKMDVYVSTMLGLPQMVSDDDIDQEYPLPIDDEYITAEGILPMPSGQMSLLAGVNAHTRLIDIVVKVVKYIYPVKNAKYGSKSEHTYMVSHSKIREIERDLQAWIKALPSVLRPGAEVSPELERMRQLLRISYAHVQMVMYRPFLHYVSNRSQAPGIDKRSYACAAACVSVSRNIVHITTGMQKRGFLNGSFWLTMYTTYFAILSLVFFVLENPESIAARESVLNDAYEGRNTLSLLAKRSLAADRCAQSLNHFFQYLPDKLKSIQRSDMPTSLKRPTPSSVFDAPQRAYTFPSQRCCRSSVIPLESVDQPTSLDDSQSNGSRFRLQIAKETFESDSADHLSTKSRTFVVNGNNHSKVLPVSMFSGLQRKHPQATVSQPFNITSPLPDLMPIMFPSEDPFAYPTQPMSTLEDGHFKNDRSGTSGSFSVETSTPTNPSLNTTLSPATSSYDHLTSLAVYPSEPPGSVDVPLPTHYQTPRLQQRPPQPRRQSPPSYASTPGSSDMVQSPDLVSIPSRSFMWQDPGFQAPVIASDHQMSAQQIPGATDTQIGTDMDGFYPMGAVIDTKTSLEDIFAKGGMFLGNAIHGGDDSSAWPSIRLEDDSLLYSRHQMPQSSFL